MWWINSLQLAVAQGSGEGWINQNSGSVLVALAAIVAATLAAYTANRRHREQLAHDREMRNRDHTRDTLDAAVEGVSTAIESVSNFAAAVETIGSQLPDLHRETDPNLNDEVPADKIKRLAKIKDELSLARNAAHDARTAMHSSRLRLEIRLSKSHPIVESHNQLQTDLSAWGAVLTSYINQEQTGAVEDDRYVNAVASDLDRFRLACGEWLSS